MKNDLFEVVEHSHDSLEICFFNKNVILDEDLKYFDESFFAVVKDKNLLFSGRGPSELYSYACYWSVIHGCKTIRVFDHITQKKYEIFNSALNISDELPVWCKIKNHSATIFEITKSDEPNGLWSEDVLTNSCHTFKFSETVRNVILTGKGSLLLYSVLACSAAVSGCKNVFVNKPTEKSLITIAGNIVFNSDKEIKKGRMIGILGDPNSGKSVFSKAFGGLLEDSYKDKSVWVYDCDASAPTSDWYIYGLQFANNADEETKIKKERENIKKPWSLELELQVSSAMKNVKAKIDYVVADLPGGKHKSEENIHERIPDVGRAEMFRNCDKFVIIARKDQTELVDAWRSALSEYGLEDRVIAEIISVDPKQMPCVNSAFFTDKGIFRAEVTGLDRENERSLLVDSYAEGFKVFLAKLIF